MSSINPDLDVDSASKPLIVHFSAPSAASAITIRSGVYSVPFGTGTIHGPYSYFIRSAEISIHHLDLGSESFRFEDDEWIFDFPGEPYIALRPIPVNVQPCDPEGFEASFTEANISWVGDTTLEALNGLKAEILNTLEDYELHQDRLGPEPERQLAVLRSYIRRDS